MVLAVASMCRKGQSLLLHSPAGARGGTGETTLARAKRSGNHSRMGWMGGTEVPQEHPGLAQGTVALSGCQWCFFPQTGGGIRHLLEARPKGHGCWGGRGSLGSPARSHTYRTWSRNSTRASWSRRTRAGSRTHRPPCRACAPSACTPLSSPHRCARRGTARLAAARTHCHSLPAPHSPCHRSPSRPACTQEPPSSLAWDMPAGAFRHVEEICSTHWVHGAQSPRHCQGLVALEVFKPSLVQKGQEHSSEGPEE